MSEFYTLFNRFYRSAKKMHKNDEPALYLVFCDKAYRHFNIYSGLMDTWIVDQNLLKKVSEGRKTIKSLCYSKFCEIYGTHGEGVVK